MEINQNEKNGIVCITINGRMGAELSPELETAIKEATIFKYREESKGE